MLERLQLQHEDSDGRPLEVDIFHKTSKYENKGTVLIVASVAGPPQKPEPQYEVLFGLGYYKFHREPLNWNEARKVCEKEGAHMVILNSEKEALALRQLWIPFPKLFDDWRNNWAYTGIHDTYKDGYYVTIFDTPLNETGYDKWYSGQPDGTTKENCGVVNRNTGTLGDVPCTSKLSFFCEQEFYFK
ncbi:Hemolymph lipopolysaccharide-binding protein [Blattella germanica]|nr:Hemolymph lipopolysaccharide-binding protein [Blattella germanica]